MKIHPSLTLERVMEGCFRHSDGENPGFCIACGADAEGCEPDARKYECEVCGEKAVYGADELLLMIV